MCALEKSRTRRPARCHATDHGHDSRLALAVGLRCCRPPPRRASDAPGAIAEHRTRRRDTGGTAQSPRARPGCDEVRRSQQCQVRAQAQPSTSYVPIRGPHRALSNERSPPACAPPAEPWSHARPWGHAPAGGCTPMSPRTWAATQRRSTGGLYPPSRTETTRPPHNSSAASTMRSVTWRKSSSHSRGPPLSAPPCFRNLELPDPPSHPCWGTLPRQMAPAHSVAAPVRWSEMAAALRLRWPTWVSSPPYDMPWTLSTPISMS